MLNEFYLEEMAAEAGAAYGDPRRCERHPNVVIGSACGMFDGVCGACEHEAEAEQSAAEWAALSPAARASIEAEYREAEAERAQALLARTRAEWGTDDIPF